MVGWKYNTIKLEKIRTQKIIIRRIILVDYGYTIMLAIFSIIFSLGIISIWINRYTNFFSRLLLGDYSLSSDDNKLLLKKVRQIATFLYIYNISILIALYFLVPDVETIITTALALSIAFLRQYVGKILTRKLGVEKNIPTKRKSNITLAVLVAIIVLLILIDNPLSMVALGLTVYILLAYLLKFIVDFGRKKPFDTSSENALRNHFDDN